jgi:hypothetical protein
MPENNTLHFEGLFENINTSKTQFVRGKGKYSTSEPSV